MMSLLRGLFMVDGLPSGDLAVYIFLEFFALGFALEAVWAFVHDPTWWKCVVWALLSFLFFIAGIKWSWIRVKIGSRGAEKIGNIASNPRYRIGVALLLVGYFAVSGIIYMHNLRNDLDQYAMPRTVVKRQADTLRQYLANHQQYAVNVTVKADPNDREAREYASELVASFVGSGWNGSLDTSNKFPAPATFSEGLLIDVEGGNSRPPVDPKHEPYQILTDALEKAHIVISGRGMTGQGEYGLYLLVGRRPLRLERGNSMLVRFGRWIEDLGEQQ